MLLLALLVGFLVPYTLFGVGEVAPGAGRGTPVAPPQKLTPGKLNARLSIKSVQPLVVAGNSFRARESVTIASEGGRKVVRASRTGTFTVRLSGGGRCSGGTITAFGSKGSRAALNLSHLLCPAP